MLEFIHFLDSAVLNWMIIHRNSSLTFFFYFITFFGKWYFIVVFSFLISYFLWRLLKKEYILPLWLLVFFTMSIVTFLKMFIHRQRPINSLHIEMLPSFPSWHSAGSIVFYGYFIFLLFKEMPSSFFKRFLIFLFVFLIGLIGFSRLYLGVHYFSDVVAGYLVGGIILFIILFIFKNNKDKFKKIFNLSLKK